MFVLIVLLVVFFSVAISSWWLDDFGEIADERTQTPAPSGPQWVPSGRLAASFGDTGNNV